LTMSWPNKHRFITTVDDTSIWLVYVWVSIAST
jgi:hypothetical protein